MNIEPICRCGDDRIVDGQAVMCPHCDRPCHTANCLHCRVLAMTCTDCRRVYFTPKKRGECEANH